ARLIDAGGDDDGVMAVAQILKRGVAADLEIQVKDHAAVLILLLAAQHDVLFQLEAGDAIDKKTADAIVAVIDMDLISLAPQFLGCGQTTRAGTYDANRAAVFDLGGKSFHPAAFPGGV